MRSWKIASGFAVLTGLLMGALATPVHATNESQAAVLALLYRPGARESALGGAGVAGARGSAASFYNPALLSWQDQKETGAYPLTLGTTYYKILQEFGFNDMYYMYFPASFNIKDWGQFSASITYLSLGEQQEVDERGIALGTFMTYTTAISFSYSSMVSENMSAGITTKWFYDHLAERPVAYEEGDPSGNGFAFDLGVAYRFSPSLMFGAALRNYGPNVQYIDASQASPTPINFNVGTSWKIIDSDYNDITFVGDIYKPLVQDFHKSWVMAPIRGWVDEDIYKVEEVSTGDGGKEKIIHRSTLREESRQVDIHAGLEYSYAEYVALRGGFYRDWDGERKWLTFGAGFHLNIAAATVTVDFGYVHALDAGNGSGADPNHGQQVYSVGLVF
jgi:hypothetical protein